MGSTAEPSWACATSSDRQGWLPMPARIPPPVSSAEFPVVLAKALKQATGHAQERVCAQLTACVVHQSRV